MFKDLWRFFLAHPFFCLMALYGFGWWAVSVYTMFSDQTRYCTLYLDGSTVTEYVTSSGVRMVSFTPKK